MSVNRLTNAMFVDDYGQPRILIEPEMLPNAVVIEVGHFHAAAENRPTEKSKNSKPHVCRCLNVKVLMSDGTTKWINIKFAASFDMSDKAIERALRELRQVKLEAYLKLSLTAFQSMPLIPFCHVVSECVNTTLKTIDVHGYVTGRTRNIRDFSKKEKV